MEAIVLLEVEGGVGGREQGDCLSLFFSASSLTSAVFFKGRGSQCASLSLLLSLSLCLSYPCLQLLRERKKGEK